MAVLTRREVQRKLTGSFPRKQAAALFDVVDNLREVELARAEATLRLENGLATLTQSVAKLSGAVQDLAQAQQRTEARVTELAEAQQRSEERLGRLEAVVERLAEAQQRTEARMAELAEAQQRTEARMDKFAQALAEFTNAVQRLERATENLQTEVGSLANRFGFNLEEFVSALLPPYLERHNGIATLTLERKFFRLEGNRTEEVDLVGEARRDGQTVTVLAECRAKIGGSEVRRIADKLEAVSAALEQETIKIIVAMNIHPTAEEAGQERGVWMIPYRNIYRER